MSTVDKALEVLGLFSERRPSVGLSEAARLLRRDKSTVQRYLASLENQGFLEQDALSRAYHLGPAVTRLSVVREITYPIETAVKNIMTKLVQDTSETVHLSHLEVQEVKISVSEMAVTHSLWQTATEMVGMVRFIL